MNNRKGLILACVLGLIAVLIIGPAGPAAAAAPIKIGVVTSRSGVLQEWGTQEIRGLTLGLMYATKGTMKVLGRPIKLIVEDDGSKPQMGVQKAVKLLTQEKVDILTGAISSAIALAIQVKALKYKKPYIVSCASADQITGSNFNRYTFRVGRTLRQASLSGSAYVLKNLGKKVAILAPDYAGGRASVAAWKKDLIPGGAKIMVELYAPLTTTDFTPYLQKIKYSGAQVLFLTIVGANFVTKLPKQIVELGIHKRMKIASGIADIKFLKALGMSGVGIVGTVMYYHELFDNPLNKWFVKAHQTKYHAPPELWAGNSFATGIAIVAAIKKAKSVQAEALIKALEGLEFYGPKTLREKMRIRPEDHQAMQGVPFVRLTKVKGRHYPVPKLLYLPSAKQCAPPITVPKKRR